MRPFAVALCVLVCSSAAIGAQEPAARARLTGVVFDSLTGKPLAGATITVSGSAITAHSDKRGQYEFDVDSLGAGTHTISFFHPELDSLGIAPPSRTIALVAGQSAVLDLAVPAPATIVSSVCPDSLLTGGRGLILGEVRDADLDKPVAGAIVVVMWSEMTVGTNTVARVPRALNVRTDARGIYRMCGVPANTPLKAQARLLPKASGWLDLGIPLQGLAIQLFTMGERPQGKPVAAGAAAAPAAAGAPGPNGAAGAAAPAAAATPAPLGTAVVAGTVTGPDGKPLEGALLAVVGTNLSARSDSRGAYRLGGLPSGTQQVEIRLLSYQPKLYAVNLAAGKTARLNPVLDQRAQVLDPVTVIAKPTTDIPGFDQRKAAGIGSFFTHQQIVENSVNQMSDIIRKVPGMQVLFVNDVYQPVSSRGAISNGCQYAQFWVDGMKFDVGMTNIDDDFKPTEIYAMEVYNSAVETPAEFQGGQVQCGTVVIWTNRGHFTPKKPTAAPAVPPSAPPDSGP